MGKKGGGLATTLVLAFVLVLVSVVVGIGISRFDFMERLPGIGPFLFDEQPTQTTTSRVVVERVQQIEELATVRVTESVIVTKESGGTRLERLLTGEKLALIAAGEVEAGVDLSDFDEEAVDIAGKSVTIELPGPEILSVALDEDETRLYDRQMSLLKREPDDDLVEEARRDAEDKILAAAKENGILEDAERNAETTTRTLLTALGFKEVRFVE